MNLAEKLEIFLITYNRKEKLAYTLGQLLAPESPVKNVPLTVLDNCSTDGTSELLAHVVKKHPHVKHIRHEKNIGGNANIVRAFEMARAEYVWVVCDDDTYDFSHPEELEQALTAQVDALFVVAPDGPLTSSGRVFKELSFVPGAIYRTSLITEDTLTNMYFNIFNLFPQLVLAAQLFNNKGKITFLPHPIVIRQPDAQYTRGTNWCHPLMKRMDWLYGFLSSVLLLQDRSLRTECVKDLRIDGDNFYNLFGRFMAQPRNKIFLYGAGLTLFPGIYKILFFLFAWPAFMCSFYKTDRGVYARLFSAIKFKIWSRP